MQKIPTLYRRNYDTRPPILTRTITRGCEWVLDGVGVPTRKWDGTCMRRDHHGHWWARREVKAGKTPPDGFIIATPTDPTTGKTIGWEPAHRSPHAKALRQAFEHGVLDSAGETYELIGPKVNGNPEGVEHHRLMPHREAPALIFPEPYSYDAIRAFVLDLHAVYGCEGIVWHHPDGRMCKIKARDYLAVPAEAAA